MFRRECKGRKVQIESPDCRPDFTLFLSWIDITNRRSFNTRHAAVILATCFQQAFAQTGISLPPTVSSKEPLRSNDGQRFLRSDAHIQRTTKARHPHGQLRKIWPRTARPRPRAMER